MSKSNMYKEKIRKLADDLKKRQEDEYNKYIENIDSFEDYYGQKNLIVSSTVGEIALELLGILNAGFEYDNLKEPLDNLKIGSTAIYIDNKKKLIVKRYNKKFYDVKLQLIDGVDIDYVYNCDLGYLMIEVSKLMDLNSIRRIV